MPQASWIQDADLAATFYDASDRPVEIVFYDDEHVQISRLVRTYDERGRVISEENRVLKPPPPDGANKRHGHPYGDLSTQRHDSTHQGDVPVDEHGNILAPPPAPETLDSETAVA